MKKLFLLITCLLAVAIVNAQSLEEIVKKFTAANKLDKVASLKTIKMTGKMSMMGMDLPIEIWMKNPDKIKSVTNINGQEMVQVFDGVKGYTISPVAGSADPVELDAQTLKTLQNSNMFSNYMDSYLKNGQLTLAGEGTVNGSPAFKIKATLEGGIVTDLFIDKASYLLTKSSATVVSQGQSITMDTYPSDYREVNGLFMAMKNTRSVMGQEIVQTYSNVEVNIPMDDSIFQLKK